MAQPALSLVAGWDEPSWLGPFNGHDPRSLKACSWCGSIEIDGSWVWENTAVRELRTYEWTKPPLFVPAICDRCACARETEGG